MYRQHVVRKSQTVICNAKAILRIIAEESGVTESVLPRPGTHWANLPAIVGVDHKTLWFWLVLKVSAQFHTVKEFLNINQDFRQLAESLPQLREMRELRGIIDLIRTRVRNPVTVIVVFHA